MSDITDGHLADISTFPAPATGTPRLISFLQSAQKSPKFESLFQEVLNLGYEEWQREENSAWRFADMVDWQRANFGDDAALITMLGKFNQQVTNGGIIQWLDNGYASDDRQRKSNRYGYQGISSGMDLTLLEQMIADLETSNINTLPHAKDVIYLLNSIQEAVEGASEECYDCNSVRYVKCVDCDGTGQMAVGEDEDGDPEFGEENCDICDGEGEIPCDSCNPDGQLERDAEEGEVNIPRYLDSRYYKYYEEWDKEIEGYLKNLVQKPGLLSKATALRTTEQLLVMLDRLIEMYS